MACFLVPTAEAVVTTMIKKTVGDKKVMAEPEKHMFLSKLGLLNNMLWGGSALLAFEHIWHGEVVPWPPFLTAAANPADAAEMLHEMAVSGTAMAAVVTLVWAGIVLSINALKSGAAKRRGAA